MKKQIVTVALAAAVATCMGVTGCSNDNSASSSNSNSNNSNGAKTELTQTANPMHESDAEGVLEATGIELTAPADAKKNSVSFFYIDASDNEQPMAQMTFTTKSGLDYTYRAQATSSTEPVDISGMYYTWTSTDAVKVANLDATVSSCDDATICTWLDVVPGIAYSLSVNGNVPASDIAAVAESVYTPAQGEN